MKQLYDTIGRGYDQLRKPDARLAEQILAALGDASTVVNVGAGTGSYEPSDRRVVAVEPSLEMIRKRTHNAAPVICASGVRLPFADGAFEASLAILTLHHWPDPAQGLAELRRVAQERTVIFTWDPSAPGFWLTDYFPEALTIDRQIFPPLSEYRRLLGDVDVQSVPIPADCTDGFLGAYWKRPEAYLRADVRAAISTFHKLSDVEHGLSQLRADLESGEWARRYGSELTGASLDLGYRLVVASRYNESASGLARR